MAPSIDKIRLYLPRTGATPDISQYLDNTMERTCRATGEVVVSGDIDGLSVYSHSGGYSVIGSLPKFLNGNNIFPLDMDSLRLAFEKMSDAFHTSVEEARVTSIEYGANLILRKSPKVYMGKFGNMPRMPIRMVTPNTVYYQTRGEHPSMRFVLYDKGRQVGKREMERYGLGGVNMLRVEDRRNGRLRQQLKVSEVTVATLQDRGFNELLAERWMSRYFSIKKQRRMMISMSAIKKPKDAFYAFVARQISGGGEASVTAFINELKANNVFGDRKAYSRVARMFDVALSFADPRAEDEDVAELDDEVRKAAGCYQKLPTKHNLLL